jgi:hypothetical protein
VDRDDGRIGTIDAIYLDDQTDQDVRVPYNKQLVKDAPPGRP